MKRPRALAALLAFALSLSGPAFAAAQTSSPAVPAAEAGQAAPDAAAGASPLVLAPAPPPPPAAAPAPQPSAAAASRQADSAPSLPAPPPVAAPAPPQLAPTPAAPPPAVAAPVAPAPLADTRLQPGSAADAVRIALVLTLAALLPALVICMTPFVRIVVVLSMIRHAFGMPETPPNQVLVSLAIFLTAFIMLPTATAVNEQALQPFLSGAATLEQAAEAGAEPLKRFMLDQVSDRDLKTVYDISDQPLPDTPEGVGLLQLTSAFMLNELRVAFQIGFVILLPFLLIDLVVSSLLLSLGMLMVPPSTISLPLKVLMFVLVDGWGLILTGVVASFR